MREALKEILRIANMPSSEKNRIGAVAHKARVALAKPMRNCDVGTPEEQDARFSHFCHHQHVNCNTCEITEIHHKCAMPFCALAWSQMPYDDGGQP